MNAGGMLGIVTMRATDGVCEGRDGAQLCLSVQGKQSDSATRLADHQLRIPPPRALVKRRSACRVPCAALAVLRSIASGAAVEERRVA